jgi:hypothetical protein
MSPLVMGLVLMCVSGGGLKSNASGIGNFFGGLLPSFDTGTFRVPNDMIANIHKGEMIIPAREAEQIRSGGMMGGVSIVQNVTIGNGVGSNVREEIAKAMPEFREAAIQAVNDARLRGGS